MIVDSGKFGKLKIKALLYEYENYEIYRTLSDAALLIVRPDLYKKWIDDNLFYAVNPFEKIVYNEKEYFYIVSEHIYETIPIKIGKAMCSRKEAVQFTFAIKQMRSRTSVSFYDGIYVEEFGYVLPTYTNCSVSDDATIGCYLSGGQTIHFSDEHFKPFLLNDSAMEEISEITGITRIINNSATIGVDIGEKETRFSLAGRPELETFFNEHIIAILNEPERYKKLGISFPSAVLLYGPPGCGKTFAVDKLVGFLGLPKFEINSATIASPYIHDTAKRISGIFESAKNSAPSVVVIDEMESYLSNRELASSNSQHYEEVAEFLRQIQDAQRNQILVIAMTNMYSKIDPAILRRGRFDHHIEVGLPSTEEITALLKNITENISIANDISLSDLANQLSGKTLADVAFVIKEAGLISGKNGDEEITLKSINSAIESLPKEAPKRRIGFVTD